MVFSNVLKERLNANMLLPRNCHSAYGTGLLLDGAHRCAHSCENWHSVPKMTGNPILERTCRAHTNMLEWISIFLPSMWLFAIYWSPTVAAALGFVWIIGRMLYFYGYIAELKKRSPAFSSNRRQRLCFYSVRLGGSSIWLSHSLKREFIEIGKRLRSDKAESPPSWYALSHRQ